MYKSRHCLLHLPFRLVSLSRSVLQSFYTDYGSSLLIFLPATAKYDFRRLAYPMKWSRSHPNTYVIIVIFLVISLDFATNILPVAHYYLIYASILPGSCQTEVKVTGLYEVTCFLVHHRWTCSRISLLRPRAFLYYFVS